MNKLLDEPAGFLRHCHQYVPTASAYGTVSLVDMCISYVGGSIMDAVYGIEIEDENDKFIAILLREAEIFGDVLAPGRYAVELFPSLAKLPSWFPGAGFKKKLPIWRRANHALRTVAYDAACEAIVSACSGTVLIIEVDRLTGRLEEMLGRL